MTTYRPDIDGLRAVAVLSVLFFHADFPMFSGGFVGVDVFFVISGYLITKILVHSVDNGTFSLSEFYRKRALRIMPAYTAMCLVCTLVAIWLLPPDLLVDFAKSLLSSALFGANFYFSEQMSYFQSAADELPLLHMWSLSVEEQFYVFWPFGILLLCAAPLKKFRPWVIGLGVLIGVILCEWAIRNKSQTMVFFYTPFRAWELMIGALVFLLPTVKLPPRWSTAASLLGAALILGPVLIYEPNRPLFPGISALVPCLGAALIIAVGATYSSIVHRMLSLRLVVFLGLISYSLYLWHWPIFAFSRYLLQGHLDFGLAILLSFVSVLAAIMSWKYIETPFRKHRFPKTGAPAVRYQSLKTLSAATCAILFTATLAGVLIFKDGLPERTSALALQASGALKSTHKLTSECLRERSPQNIKPFRENCVFGNSGAQPVAALWGDSHANAFVPALERQAQLRDTSFELLAMQSCSPLMMEALRPDYGGRGVDACIDFNDAVLNYLLAADHVKVVYVSSYWTTIFENVGKSGLVAESSVASTEHPPAPNPEENFIAVLAERIVDPLRQAGKTVVLVGQPPLFSRSGGRCLARKAFLDQPLSECDLSLKKYLATTGKVNEVLDDVPEAMFIDPVSAFCDQEKCTPYPQNIFAFRDEHHLSVEGALLLADSGIDFLIGDYKATP